MLSDSIFKRFTVVVSAETAKCRARDAALSTNVHCAKDRETADAAGQRVPHESAKPVRYEDVIPDRTDLKGQRYS